MPFTDAGNLRQRILEALNAWPRTETSPTVGELATRLGESEALVEREVDDLLRRGHVQAHHVLNRDVRLAITREGREALLR
jgi:DNA-binding MarR family transcriptional regulator